MTLSMGTKTKAYVDTSALIAFLDVSDSWHSLFRGLFADPPELITSSLVIAEGHGWFLKRYDRVRALQFMAFIEDLTVLKTATVGHKEVQASTAILRKYPDQDLTQVDATGLYLMQLNKINSCWSTDFHLGLTGVPLVIHEH